MLDRVHRIDTDRIPPPPVSSEGRPASHWWCQLSAVADTVRPLLDGELAARARPYLVGRVPEPPDDGARRFIHHDISADHVLVDPDIGRLLGIIDFTDATVGDRVGDFVGLVGIGDRRFVDQVLAAYDLPLGDTFLDRYQWLTRTLTLIWLGEAATSDPAAVRKHTTWV